MRISSFYWVLRPPHMKLPPHTPTPFRFNRIMSADAMQFYNSTDNLNSYRCFSTAETSSALVLSTIVWSVGFFRSTTMTNNRLRLIRQATRMLSVACKPTRQTHTHTHTAEGNDMRRKRPWPTLKQTPAVVLTSVCALCSVYSAPGLV